MHPCGSKHRTDALRDDCHVLDGRAGFPPDMGDETVEIADRRAEGWREAAHARRLAVAARIPGIEGVVIQPQLIDEVRDTAAMLVPAMQQDDDAFRLSGKRRPETVEQRRAVMGREPAFLRHAMRFYCLLVHASLSSVSSRGGCPQFLLSETKCLLKRAGANRK